MKRLIFGFLILASLLGGCVIESDLDTDEQALEGTDDVYWPFPWPGLPGSPRAAAQPDDVSRPVPWPGLPGPRIEGGPGVQCDEGPHCCPDPRGCPPTLPK